jgi:hypothetical protein
MTRITCFLLILLLGTYNLAAATLKCRLVDPEGNPVAGARVEASLSGKEVVLKSDALGEFTLRGNFRAHISLVITKDGFYETSGNFFSGGKVAHPESGKLVNRRPDPDPVIVLKRKINPIEMTGRWLHGFAPATGKPLGFDFKRRDWVSPFGHGQIADIFFHFHDIEVRGHRDHTGSLTISFPNEGDGILHFSAPRSHSFHFGSNLTPPAVAPEEGYEASLTLTVSADPDKPAGPVFNEQDNYLFRTRTRLDEDGRVLAACYGWIRGPVRFNTFAYDYPVIEFCYLFNPDPDPKARSLEAIAYPEAEFFLPGKARRRIIQP